MAPKRNKETPTLRSSQYRQNDFFKDILRQKHKNINANNFTVYLRSLSRKTENIFDVLIQEHILLEAPLQVNFP